jgi:geranylgeranyl diphosphate synthase type II
MGSPDAGRIEELRRMVDAGLDGLRPQSDWLDLHRAVDYVLEGSGKRVRPLLVLAANEAFGGSSQAALPAALAVEVFHNFTLVHDDIMDRSDSRRGRPSVHVKWDESVGILAGDFLLGLSYDLLTRLEAGLIAPAIHRFHDMVVKLCEGQALDTAFERRETVDLDAYMQMVSLKTAALIEVSLAFGGMTAHARVQDVKSLELIGRHAGCAFQIQDDLLDLMAESQEWGKPVGGDLMVGKKSFLTVRAMECERSESDCWFAERMRAGGIQKNEVDEARSRLSKMGILEDADRAIKAHYDEALGLLDELGKRADISYLLQIIEGLLKRNV